MIETDIAAETVKLDEPWTAEIYRQWDFPAEVAEWWQAASDMQGDVGLFTSPEWLRMSWLAWATPLFVVVLRESSRIKGIFPCHIARTDEGDHAICSLAVDANHYDFLTQGDTERTVEAFVRLIELHFPGHHLFFEYVPEASASIIRRNFQARKFSTWSYSEPFAPYIDVDGSWDEFFSSLSPNLRKELRRKRRLAEQEGSLTWEVVRGPEGLDELLNEAIAIEARSWKGRAGHSMAQKPALERFVRLMCQWGAREHRLFFLSLRLNGRIIAFQINLLNAGTMFGCKTSFDEAASRYSPGQMAVAELLQRCFEDATIHRMNLGGQYDAWKVRWTKKTASYHYITVYPRKLSGYWQYLTRHGWKESLKRSATAMALASTALAWAHTAMAWAHTAMAVARRVPVISFRR